MDKIPERAVVFGFPFWLALQLMMMKDGSYFGFPTLFLTMSVLAMRVIGQDYKKEKIRKTHWNDIKKMIRWIE